MRRKDFLLHCRDVVRQEMFPDYAWPGGYPVLYLDKDNSVLCGECAFRSAASDFSWGPYSHYIHWEGSPDYCDDCSTMVESAYGELTPEK